MTGGFHDYWLASRQDGLYTASSALIARSPNGTAGRHVGEEVEIYGAFDVNQTMQVGAGYGHLFSGEFLNRTTRRSGYDYPYLTFSWLL